MAMASLSLGALKRWRPELHPYSDTPACPCQVAAVAPPARGGHFRPPPPPGPPPAPLSGRRNRSSVRTSRAERIDSLAANPTRSDAAPSRCEAARLYGSGGGAGEKSCSSMTGSAPPWPPSPDGTSTSYAAPNMGCTVILDALNAPLLAGARSVACIRGVTLRAGRRAPDDVQLAPPPVARDGHPQAFPRRIGNQAVGQERAVPVASGHRHGV